MDWSELYAVLFDLQGRRCMAQVQLAEGDMPLLTAFGALVGGPNGEVLSPQHGDTITLGLASSVQGSNGAIMLQERHFQGTERPSPNHLTILHGGARLLLAFGNEGESADDEVEPADD
jgi:hypothetical protein